MSSLERTVPSSFSDLAFSLRLSDQVPCTEPSIVISFDTIDSPRRRDECLPNVGVEDRPIGVAVADLVDDGAPPVLRLGVPLEGEENMSMRYFDRSRGK